MTRWQAMMYWLNQAIVLVAFVVAWLVVIGMIIGMILR